MVVTPTPVVDRNVGLSEAWSRTKNDFRLLNGLQSLARLTSKSGVLYIKKRRPPEKFNLIQSKSAR
jgi:hypothetical protein